MTRLDRLLAVLEPYAAGRVVERELRRTMQSRRCSRAGEDVPRCYIARDEDPCEACRARTEDWKLFKSQRAANKALLRRVETLALRLSVPDPSEEPEPEEPKLLLDLMT